MVTIATFFNMLTEVEFLFLGFLFSWNDKRRKNFYLRLVSFSLIAVLLSFPTQFVEYIGKNTDIFYSSFMGVVNYSLLFMYGLIVLWLCFETKPSHSFFLAILANNLRHLIYLTWQLINYIVSDATSNDPMTYHWYWVVIAVSLALAYLPLIIRLYRYVRDFPEFALPPNSLMYFSFFALFINVILNMFVIQTDFSSIQLYLKYILNLFNIFGCVLILLVMIGFASRISLREEISAVNQMRHEEEKQYQVTKETIDLINIKCHDLRHQIRKLGEGENTVSKEQLKEMEDAIRIYDTRLKTGNAPLDLILQEKGLICRKENIVFDCIIDGKLLSFMEDGEIYSLFGNVIENAIEASKEVENVRERVITLKIKKVAGGVFCYEENRTQGNLVFKDGLPVTTKNDAKYHGYGMKSIQMTVNRYHGTLSVKAEGNRFMLSLFFPEIES